IIPPQEFLSQTSNMMDLTTISQLELPPTADFHCHLRDGAMCELVAPMIRSGGADIVYVMPNLQPPITQILQAHRYHETLTRLAPGVRFLMSLFLHPNMTPETVAEAARSEIIYGMKLYPAGVTTNSQDGVKDIEQLYPIFKAMQDSDLILNIHGEQPGATTLRAEAEYTPVVSKIHAAFPSLRIVLEHISTREGLEL
ncbi:MAG: hypothetical protein M1835_003349, partial [Candelina submexicana]